MPRKFVHKPGTAFRKNYPPESLEHALEAVVCEQISFSQAEERFGVPKATIWRKFKGMTRDKLGRPSVLSVTEEKNIVDALLIASKFGYPFDRNGLKLFVQEYLNRKGVEVRCFRNNMPGDDWILSFESRNKELTRRNCENMKRSKAELTPELLRSYFTELEETLAGVLPENLINYDETNISDDPGTSKLFAQRGTKHPRRIMDSSKMSHSVMFCVAGDGGMLPPYVVYKAKNLYPEWVQGGPQGCRYNRSKSGWFDSVTFEDWFIKIALPYFRRRDGRKVMIGDNLVSHISAKIIQLCEQNNISFVLLPPNSTQVCQPLDVAVFGPMKKAWRKVLLKWKSKNKGVVPKPVFPGLLNEMLISLQPTMEANIKSGFASSGIIPVDSERVIRKIVPRGNLAGQLQIDQGNLVGTFTQIMADRTAVDETRTRKRQPKIDVPAGRSVSLADFRGNNNMMEADNEVDNNNQDIENSDEEDTGNANNGTDDVNNEIDGTEFLETEDNHGNLNDTTGQSNENNCDNVNNKIDGGESSASEDDHENLNDITDQCEENICDDDTEEAEPNKTAFLKLKVPFRGKKDMEQLKIGCFIIASFVYNRNTKKENPKIFLGQITEIRNSGKITVSFLRSHRGRKYNFIFPDVPDICSIDVEQIQFLVSDPKISRGIHVFYSDIL